VGAGARGEGFEGAVSEGASEVEAVVGIEAADGDVDLVAAGAVVVEDEGAGGTVEAGIR